ncbi:MAG: peptidylprolyl isomerase [Planctomycetaceae bacterium]|nr:peptidylprolyl isomerase [Planctomycetaceae bacterium]
MKHLFYTLLILASAGTVVCVTNPKLAEECAARIGWKLQLQPEEKSGEDKPEDRLSQFLSQYPFAKNSSQDRQTSVQEPYQESSTPPSSYPQETNRPEPETAAYSPAPAALEQDASPIQPLTVQPVIQPTSLRNDAERWDSSAVVPVTDITPAAVQSAAAEQPLPVSDPFLTNTASPPVSVYEQLPMQTADVNHQPLERQPIAAQAVVPQQPVSPPPVQSTVEYSIETIPCHGAEMVARVGTQVILMCDILPRLRRFAMKMLNDNLNKIPEEERKTVPVAEKNKFIEAFIKSQYPAFLQEQIGVALIYNDYALSKTQQEREYLDRRIGEDFDQTEVPEMMKEFGVNSSAALKLYLQQQLGSSLDRERMLWVRDRIAQQWLMSAVQQANGESTYEQLRQYYDKNRAEFSSEAKAKWQEMVVLFQKYPSEEESLRKIQWMGNQVAGGAPFEEIAKANSDGFTASKGGLYDWTTKGSIASTELEQAVFSLPVGQLSPAILRTDKGFHLIRVVERQEASVVPFIEAQVKIRERIKNQRWKQYQEEYFAELKRRYPSMVVKERIDFAIGTKTSSLR